MKGIHMTNNVTADEKLVIEAALYLVLASMKERAQTAPDPEIAGLIQLEPLRTFLDQS